MVIHFPESDEVLESESKMGTHKVWDYGMIVSDERFTQAIEAIEVSGTSYNFLQCC